MELLKTRDGSLTAYNEEFQENYHSMSGALEEAFGKHVDPLGIEPGMKILDFCFGFGYNSFAACKKESDLDITALELDPKVITAIAEVTPPDELSEQFRFFSGLKENQDLTDEKGNRIQLILGDALKTVKELPKERFDRIYFDPFSPKKAPHMWTVELFRELHSVLKTGGKLSTYSCARVTRENLTQAGFDVQKGPCIGGRAPSTIATK